MTAILLRDVRNNGKWALLAMLALAGVMAYLAYQGQANRRYSYDNNTVLVTGQMNMATGFGFPAVGLALGLLVILEDSSRGRWALLTHRPIPRGRIFLGKLLAGLLLYLAATALPLAVLTAWVATPGNLAAPFDWHMVLPRLAHLTAGIAWLGAGMLIAGRRARWIGSRLFPAGAALVASVWMMLPMVGLREVFVVPIVAAGALILAAWGMFGSGGEYETQPWMSRLLVAATVAVGVAIALGLSAGILSESADAIAPSRPNIFSEYVLDNGGHVLRMDEDYSKSLYRETYYTSTAGTGAARQAIDDNHVESAYVWNLADIASVPGVFDEGSYVQNIQSPGSEVWYFVPHRRTIEGYDANSRRYVGSLGPAGFTPASQRAQAFPPGTNVSLGNYLSDFAFDTHSVWSLTMTDHPPLQLMYAAPANEPIVAVASLGARTARPNGTDAAQLPEVAVISRSNVRVFSQDRETVRLPIPSSFTHARQYSISLVHTGGGYVVLYDNRFGLADSRWSAVLLRTDAEGRILSRTELPKPPVISAPDPAWEAAATTIAAPPMLLLTKSWINSHDPFRGGNLGPIAVALAAAAAGWLLMRRYVATSVGRLQWTILCGLLGIGGVLLLLCTRTAVARVQCPKCGRRRRVAENHCEHCGAPFPASARAGIEIFESRHAVEVER